MNSTLEKISVEIGKLKSATSCLERYSEGLPALNRNLHRIAASIKMLEINFVDPAAFLEQNSHLQSE